MSSAVGQEAVDLESAVSAWLDEGFAILALYGITPDGFCACGQPDCESPGKHPRHRHGVHAATRNLDRILRWISGYVYLNIAVSAEGFRIYDCDARVGEESFETLAELYGQEEFPPTKRQTTGRGSHVIYRDEAGTCSSRLAGNLPSLDVRGRGGFIVAAPSKHRSGRRYVCDQTPIATLPDWAKDPPPGSEARSSAPPPSLPLLADGATRYGRAAVRDELALLASMLPEQGRHKQLNDSSFRLGGLVVTNHLDLLTTYDGLLETAQSIGINYEDAKRIAKSGLGAGIRCGR